MSYSVDFFLKSDIITVKHISNERANMKFISGLVSVSFRSLGYEEIIEVTKSSGLFAIEWGGDIHSPAGDIEKAGIIRKDTAASGITVAEYGSYYRLGSSNNEQRRAIVTSARELGCDTVRVWASVKNRPSHTEEEYSAVIDDTRELCKNNPDLVFALECHNNTLTEDYRDAIAFLEDVSCPNLKMFWQPNQYRDHEYNLAALSALLPFIVSVHVFAWEGDRKLPLASHAHLWRDYLDILKGSDAEKIYLMLEFMYDNSVSSLKSEADTLNSWIE